MLTPEILSRCMPRASKEACETWAGPIQDAAVEFGIAEPNRLATMLASIANETGQLSRFEEASYFTTPIERIAYIFGARTPPLATLEHWKAGGRHAFDVAFFNHFYGTRLGNRDPGDGYKFRGLGPGQITGRANCAQIGPMIGVDLVANPEAMLEPVTGARAFAAFLKINRVTDMSADGSDAGFLRAMKVMNSGLNDHEFRTHHLARWREVRRGLASAPPKPAPATPTQAAAQVVTGKTGAAAVVAAGATGLTIADAAIKIGEAQTAATATKGLLSVIGIPAEYTPIVLGGIAVVAIGLFMWRYGFKLLRGEAVST